MPTVFSHVAAPLALALGQEKNDIPPIDGSRYRRGRVTRCGRDCLLARYPVRLRIRPSRSDAFPVVRPVVCPSGSGMLSFSANDSDGSLFLYRLRHRFPHRFGQCDQRRIGHSAFMAFFTRTVFPAGATDRSLTDNAGPPDVVPGSESACFGMAVDMVAVV